MKKVKLIFLLLMFTRILPAQQMLGGGFGRTFGSYFPTKNYLGSLELNYLVAAKHFAAKANISFEPFTRFGFTHKYILSLGYTTKLSNKISFHFLVGGGAVFSTRTHGINNSDYNYNGLTFADDATATINSGFYFNPFKKNNLYFGLGAYVHKEVVDFNYHNYLKVYPLSVGLTINYLIRKNEKKPTS